MRTDRSLVTLALLGKAIAFWRLECRGQAGMSRIDPLVTPGAPSFHAHAIHGSSGFGLNPSYEDLVNADCTSCAVTQDKSAYWAPALYFKHADGEYELVEQVGGMLAYYFLAADAQNPEVGVKAFPNNFRMIAGDTTRRNYTISGKTGTNYMDPDPEKSVWASMGQTKQSDLAQRAIGFNCLHYGKDAEGALYRHYLPDKGYLDANCIDGIRIEIMFPSCWDGKNTQSADHMSHVAYPDLVMNGDCPPDFPVKLPGLFFETIWNTPAFSGKAGEFVLSNGDVQGFGYHADFISGWPEELLQDAINTCTNLSGRQEDCPIFNLQSEADQRKCKFKVPEVLAREKTEGRIGMSLPGGVAIRYGPEPAVGPAPAASESHTTHVAVPTVTYKPGASSVILPGGVFKEGTTTVPAPEPSKASILKVDPSSAPAPEPTPEPAPEPTPTPAPAPVDPPVPEGYQLVRTDWHTNGNVVSKVVVIETLEYVTLATATETVTVTATFGDKARREVQHLHRHRGHGMH
ncbi:hypothetical protein QBC38DRAFT_140897 [Podospora fimiseda]|uniref:DUF1996 domain-containing protein n=1 Tax=Podospora fimiseda TaxID=252190 RepID=A0AAN7H5V2_9PEZI|nr:hypothetical protein QBC38DRAFT_140897 [Podospora fimiseda]